MRTGKVYNQFPKANTQSNMTKDCNLDPGRECGEDNVRTATTNDEIVCYRLQLPQFLTVAMVSLPGSQVKPSPEYTALPFLSRPA
jgi:hypothetical protein